MKFLKILSTNKIYIIFLIFFTFILSECATIYILNLKYVKKQKLKDSNKIESVLNSNRDIKYYRTISSMKPILVKEEIIYRTDQIGAILPSSFENIDKKDNYVIFCGGSTTESSQNNENKRPVDIFTNKSGIKAINIAKSGKGFNGCIDSFEFFSDYIEINFKDYKKPSYYVIATNINTFSDFLREYANQDQYVGDISLFGTNFIKKIITKYKRIKRNNLIGIKLSEYEHAVIEGCCFGPSKVNNSNKSLKKIYWDDPKLKKSYSFYLSKLAIKLNSFLQKYNINRNRIVVFIEPNSYDFKYENLYRKYWKNIDSRQIIKNPNIKKLPIHETSKIIDNFDQIYIEEMQNNNLLIINGKKIKFPKWSFYDAIHYTDYGAMTLGSFYKNKISTLMQEN